MSGAQPKLKMSIFFSLVNSFHATGLLLHSLKISENQNFCDVFKWYKKRPVAWNGLLTSHMWCVADLVLFVQFKKPENSRNVKGTVMQIEKALINDRLHVSKVFWKFCIPTISNFAVIYQWILLFSEKNSIPFNRFYCKNFTVQ